MGKRWLQKTRRKIEENKWRGLSGRECDEEGKKVRECDEEGKKVRECGYGEEWNEEEGITRGE